MTYSERARTAPRGVRLTAVVVAVGVIAAGVGRERPASSSSATPIELPGSPHRDRRALGVAGGAIPHAATVFDDDLPGVANLDPDLLDALRRAAGDAASDGIEVMIDSGWRSRAYQEQLLDEAIRKYGSQQEAARWVATPKTSAHVSGQAVDVGPVDAAAWLSEYGAEYGLCQVYGNEPWHFERRPDAVDDGCPAMYADPTDDPRMQQR